MAAALTSLIDTSEYRARVMAMQSVYWALGIHDPDFVAQYGEADATDKVLVAKSAWAVLSFLVLPEDDAGLLGDAAAMLDPTSFHGVLKALMSGMTAGHLIAAALSGGAPADEIASAYHRWIAGWFATDAARLRGFYRDIGATGFA